MSVRSAKPDTVLLSKDVAASLMPSDFVWARNSCWKANYPGSSYRLKDIYLTGDHCHFCYVSCLLWQLNSQLSLAGDLKLVLHRILYQEKWKHGAVCFFVFFFSNYSNFQHSEYSLRNYLTLRWRGWNPQPRTGFSKKGEKCKSRHASPTTVCLVWQ